MILEYDGEVVCIERSIDAKSELAVRTRVIERSAELELRAPLNLTIVFNGAGVDNSRFPFYHYLTLGLLRTRDKRVSINEIEAT